MQKIKDWLLKVKKQKTARWNQHDVSNVGNNIGKWIYDVHELIEKLAIIGLNCNKQMLYDIKWLKKFPT